MEEDEQIKLIMDKSNAEEAARQEMIRKNDELLAMYDKDPFALLEHFITNCTEGNFRKLKNAIKEQWKI